MSYPKTLYGGGAYRVVKNEFDENEANKLGYYDQETINETVFNVYPPIVDVASNRVESKPKRKYTRRMAA